MSNTIQTVSFVKQAKTLIEKIQDLSVNNTEVKSEYETEGKGLLSQCHNPMPPTAEKLINVMDKHFTTDKQELYSLLIKNTSDQILLN